LREISFLSIWEISALLYQLKDSVFIFLFITIASNCRQDLLQKRVNEAGGIAVRQAEHTSFSPEIRKQQREHPPIHIDGTVVERVAS
jgi:hypothetical protein